MRAARQESARLQAEVGRLRESLRELERERDSYRKAVYAWLRNELTAEDIVHFGQEEEGLPLQAFLPELEQIIKGQ